MDKFIITGTGRSGTKYCQAILKVCGINCGHQSVFRHENTLSGAWDWGDYDGDSSFEAVPMLGKVKELEPGTKVILVLRDMENTIKSQLKWGWFQDSMREEYRLFSQVLDTYFPSVLSKGNPQERALEYYELWNKEAERYAHLICSLESLSPEIIFYFLGFQDKYDDTLVETVRKDTNSKLR